MIRSGNAYRCPMSVAGHHTEQCITTSHWQCLLHFVDVVVVAVCWNTALMAFTSKNNIY